MTTRSGWTINGKHFQETWTTRLGSPRLCCFIDGKQVSRDLYKRERALAKAAEEAKKGAE